MGIYNRPVHRFERRYRNATFLRYREISWGLRRQDPACTAVSNSIFFVVSSPSLFTDIQQGWKLDCDVALVQNEVINTELVLVRQAAGGSCCFPKVFLS